MRKKWYVGQLELDAESIEVGPLFASIWAFLDRSWRRRHCAPARTSSFLRSKNRHVSNGFVPDLLVSALRMAGRKD